MNYAKFNTTSEILEAFQALHGDKGMEMELFEGLATRSDPPTTAFAEILQRIKLESALVLAIKAFGQITDADLQGQLKQSDDLLVMLSRQASTGSSDLIRWAAATTIDRIGFSFLATSQHLSERPADIAANIVESKRKILVNYDDNTHREQKITDLADYKAFIDFWVYGATYDLRSITVNCCGNNSSLVVSEVVKAQSIHGIKETNKLLHKTEQRDYPDELTRKAYNNELFEKFTRPLSIELLAVKNPYGFKYLVINQGQDLQHHQLNIRVKAASILAKLDRNDVLNELNDRGDLLLLMAEMILVCDRDLQWKYPYEEMVRDDLEELATNLTRVINQLWREPVKKYYSVYLNKISQDIQLLEPGQSLACSFYHPRQGKGSCRFYPCKYRSILTVPSLAITLSAWTKSTVLPLE